MNRKQLRILVEILDSERTYVHDLWLWAVYFKEAIKNCSNMHYLRKEKLCKKIYVNIDRIFDLHRYILKDLEMQIKEFAQQSPIGSLDGGASAERFEYHTVFGRLLEEACIYKTYVFGLPMAKHVIREELNYNPRFRELAGNFLDKHGVGNLDIDHFVLRPIQKLARYPLFLSSLLKHEESTEYTDKIRGFINKLDSVVKSVDRCHGKAKNFFRIYEISKCLKRGNHMLSNISLNLFSKKRVLYKEGEVVVCTKNLKPDIRNVMVFDSMILICDTVVQYEKECLYLQEVLAPHEYLILREDVEVLRHESVRNRCPIYLIDRLNRVNIVKFYFENKVVRNIWKDIIVHVMAKVEKGFDKCISIVKMEEITTEYLQCMCTCIMRSTEIAQDGPALGALDTESDTSSIKSDERSRQIIEMKMVSDKALDCSPAGNVTFAYEPPNEEAKAERKLCMFKWIFGFGASVKNIAVERVESLENGKILRVYSTPSGIYMQLKYEHVRVHTFGDVTKLVYDENLNILIFQNRICVYVSVLNSSTSYLAPKLLVENAQSFFYNTYANKNYAAIIERQNSSSNIYLFELTVHDATIRFLFTRKLYMGSHIYDIKPFGMNIVVASKDFELVDLDSPMTQELIPSYHIILPYYFFLCKDYHAKTILRTNAECHIVCFNNLAFVIDRDLRPNNSNIVFTWHYEPSDFRVSGNYFAVLGVACISLFSVSTGKLVFFDNIKTFHFLDSNMDLLLHDRTSLYRLKYPKAEVCLEN